MFVHSRYVRRKRGLSFSRAHGFGPSVVFFSPRCSCMQISSSILFHQVPPQQTHPSSLHRRGKVMRRWIFRGLKSLLTHSQCWTRSSSSILICTRLARPTKRPPPLSTQPELGEQEDVDVVVVVVGDDDEEEEGEDLSGAWKHCIWHSSTVVATHVSAHYHIACHKMQSLPASFQAHFQTVHVGTLRHNQAWQGVRVEESFHMWLAAGWGSSWSVEALPRASHSACNIFMHVRDVTSVRVFSIGCVGHQLCSPHMFCMRVLLNILSSNAHCAVVMVLLGGNSLQCPQKGLRGCGGSLFVRCLISAKIAWCVCYSQAK